MDAVYIHHRVLEGSWEFAHLVTMCFVNLRKAFNLVPHGIQRIWVLELFAKDCSVSGWDDQSRRDDWSRSFVCIAGIKSDLFKNEINR